MGLPDSEIARRLGCDASLPGKLRRKGSARRPGLSVAHAIERLTATRRDDGARWPEPPIKTEEWIDNGEANAKARRRSSRKAA